MQTIFLFDVDGVLLIAKGYKEALRAAVDHFAAQMGQSAVNLTYDEIAVFEACGMTNEWVSGSLSVAALLLEAARLQPDTGHSTLQRTLIAIKEAGLILPRPDLGMLARTIFETTESGIYSSKPLLIYFLDLIPDSFKPALHDLLDEYRPPQAPFGLVFQHFTLGHERFEETYEQAPQFESNSYLLDFDILSLSSQSASRLGELTRTNAHHMAIYTARPGLPPSDLTSEEQYAVLQLDHPPEADFVLDLLGLDFDIPLISGGRMSWLAIQHEQHPGMYIKPSPVHALAAIGAALTGEQKAALKAAYEFYETQQISGPLAMLEETTSRIVVFEDSAGGIRAVHGAVELLQNAGLDVIFEAVGVAPEQSKRDILLTVANRVEDDINAALIPYLN